jgi:ABC-type polysaccharide/polyol phosphate transport system ATPase subunit
VGCAVEIVGVGKRFRLSHERYTSLKERAIHLGKIHYDDLWALKDVNQEIAQGETIGLLGHNGSGKSTLLKCIAGILQPTTGQIRTAGRLAALLELGAGFHPDLSGRENVFLNASLLGLHRREVETKFDEIVGFAELEHAIDQQVKYYSSGMYVRLGFAVAVNMDPDILLVDEVLAVGDELFQRKCLDRVRQFQREGRTIIVVSHSADMVRQVCDRALVLDQGEMVAVGTPGEAVRAYREHLLRRQRFDEVVEFEPEPEPDHGADAASTAAPAGGSTTASTQEGKRNLTVRITSVTFEYPESDSKPYLVSGEPFTIRIRFQAMRPIDDLVCGIAVYDTKGWLLFGWNTDTLDIDLGRVEGSGEVAFSVAELPLLDGTYPVTIGLHSHDEATVYDWSEQRHSFEVMCPTRAAGILQLQVAVTVNGSAVTERIGAA